MSTSNCRPLLCVCASSTALRLPHVSVCESVQLLESCVSNCGSSFRAEMSDSQVLADLGDMAKGVSCSGPCCAARASLNGRLTSSSQARHSSAVSGRMRALLASWVAEFGHEPGFAAVRQFKDSLGAQGVQFPSAVARGGNSSAPQSSSQREMDDLKRAIELSLQEQQQPKAKAPSTSLYPSVGGVASKQSTWDAPKPPVGGHLP